MIHLTCLFQLNERQRRSVKSWRKIPEKCSALVLSGNPKINNFSAFLLLTAVFICLKGFFNCKTSAF